MTTNRNPPWDVQEIDALIKLYFANCQHVDNGTSYDSAKLICMAQGADTDSKSALPNGAGKLSSRSRHSIEAKLMNVTACLHDLSYAGTSLEQHGYKALGNYQAALKTAIADLLDV